MDIVKKIVIIMVITSMVNQYECTAQEHTDINTTAASEHEINDIHVPDMNRHESDSFESALTDPILGTHSLEASIPTHTIAENTESLMPPLAETSTEIATNSSPDITTIISQPSTTPVLAAEGIVPDIASAGTSVEPQEAMLEMDATPEEPIGIDTINLQEPQGNWLFKRIWWERAQERYEKIRALVDQIWEYRVGFFLSRSDIDRTKLDPFYVAVGFSQGELQQVLTDLIAHVEEKHEHGENLDSEELGLVGDIQEQKKILENLRTDVEGITTLDHALDKALERLMEQINRVRTYERDAWNQFKEIAQVLSDTKARELYYKMDVEWRNIKDIHKYLQQDFVTHFQELIQKLTTELERIKLVISGLKEKGLDLKKQSELILDIHKKPTHDLVEEVEEEEIAPVRGWGATIMGAITDGAATLWNTLTYPVVFVYHKIFGGPSAQTAEDEQD